MSSPTKRSCAHSSSCSCSHSPPRHHQHRYATPECTSRDSNMQGRHGCHAAGGKGKNKSANPSFFQGATVGHGTSACAICLGCHEYAKFSTSKLWNRGKVCVKKQARSAHLPQQPPSLFQFPNPGRVFRPIPPLVTHMFRVWQVSTWHPAVCSGTEELIHSPLTSQAHGAVSLTNTAFLKNTQPYTIALCMVLILESLAYLNHTFQLIAQLFISCLHNMKKLWRKSFIKEDTLVPSCKQNWNPLLDPSSHPPSPLFLNLENPENFTEYTTSPTPISCPQIWSHPSTQPSTCMSFPAHGGPFQQYPLSFLLTTQIPGFHSRCC